MFVVEIVPMKIPHRKYDEGVIISCKTLSQANESVFGVIKDWKKTDGEVMIFVKNKIMRYGKPVTKSFRMITLHKV